MGVSAQVRRVRAIAASITVLVTVLVMLVMLWLASVIGLLPGDDTLWPIRAAVGLLALISLCVLLALSLNASRRRATDRS